MDVLDDILSSLRLSGGVVVDGEFSGDFSVPAEFTPGHFEPFYAVPDKLISYHYVRSGRLTVEVDGMAPATLGAGSVAILPRNDPHRLTSRIGLAPADAGGISKVTTEGVHRVTAGTDGPKTEVWCGFLEPAKTSEHPLLDALPAMLTLDISGGEAEWLDSSMRFLAEQQPSAEVVARLAELFVNRAVREYLDRLPAGASGWLRGLADPAVSRALAIIHARYAEELDIETLARESGVSRTVLGERFVELLGEPPMRYCGRWRMRVAASMLRDGKQHVANVAYAVGFNSEAAFTRAFKREYGEPPATWRRKLEDAAAQGQDKPVVLPEQTVRYCTAKDGTRLAFSVTGEGPPLVKAANWLNHIEHDWKSPVWRHWLHEFTNGHTLIRYDERANGLSDWDTPELSLDAFVDDLECVVDCAGLETFDLLAISQGASVAIAYAVRHPERVRKLVICGGYAAGWAVRNDPDERARREALITMTEIGWGADHPTYRQVFTALYIPNGTPEQIDWFNEVQRVSASPENAVKLQRALSEIDARSFVPQVSVPTLIFHSKNDHVVPFSAGEYLAQHIPGATFVPLEGENHILLEGEPAWGEFVRLTREFLSGADWQGRPAPVPAAPRTDVMSSVRVSDGTRIAYADTPSSTGFPIVKMPNWMTHLEHDWTSPVYGHWLEFAAQFGRLIRMDLRGFGKSDWAVSDFGFDTIVGDVEAVIDDAGVERCDLLGISHGASFAIAYAARHPERVRKLILVNSFAAGWRVRNDPEEIAWRESLLEMNRSRPAFRRSLLGEMFITLYFPSASEQLIDWHNRLFQTLGPVKSIEPVIDLASRMDVRAELAKVRAETLVVHADRDGNAPPAAGREVAEGIAGARFVAVESANHVLLGDEPAWRLFTREARAFLEG